MLPFYGFDRVHLTVDHGDDIEGHYRRWLRAQDPDGDRLIGPANALPTPGLALAAARQAWRTRLPPELHPTAYCAAMSEAVLAEAASGAAPFFLMCSFAEPHHPFTPPGKYWDMYRPEEIEPAALVPRRRNPSAAPCRAGSAPSATRAARSKHTPQLFACTEQEAREAIALNYGSISFIDDAVGRVLARLEALGLAANTVVMFTADHGDFMGDHQLLLKGPIHYRGLIRAPFIWRDPERGPRGAALGRFRRHDRHRADHPGARRRSRRGTASRARIWRRSSPGPRPRRAARCWSRRRASAARWGSKAASACARS